MTHKLKRVLRGSALLGVAAIAAGSLGLVSAPAFADPGDGGKGTVTVHKLEQGDKPIGENDGSELPSTGGLTPLVAGFTACAIDGFDLSKSGDWARMKHVKATLDVNKKVVLMEDTKVLSSVCGTEIKTTAAAGIAKFDLDADKAYVIYESTPAVNAVSVAGPTVITVPFPGTTANPGWNYNPHIYPKNIIAGSGSTKTGNIVGDYVDFDVTVPVKALGVDEKYTQFEISDKLANEVKYTAASVVLKSASDVNVPLVAGTDYTISAPNNVAGDTVVLKFLAEGLKKLDANINGKVVLSIAADLLASGTTENEATVTINGKATDPGTGPEVVDPETFWGGAHVLKLAQNKGAANTVPLAGAEFSLYIAASKTATSCPADPTSAPALKLVQAGLKSGANGKTPAKVLGEGAYCAYETKVPAGYKGLVGGALLTVQAANASVDVVNTQFGVDPDDLPALPITGAAGNVLLLGGGALLLGAAGVLFAARRRKLGLNS